MRELAAILIVFLITANLILYHYFPKPKKPKAGRVYDAAIVLGSPAKEDGSLSRMQKTRMDAAIRLYKQHTVQRIIISGGSVRNDYAEAEIMAAYAITCGIAKEVLHSRQVDPELHTLVKGLMIESYIEPGNHKIGCDHIYGKSITDPCLGWEESERLLYTIAEMC